MGGACGTHERHEKCIQNFGRKAEGKRPFESPRHRRKDNVRLNLREVGWIHLAEDRVQWRTVVNILAWDFLDWLNDC